MQKYHFFKTLLLPYTTNNKKMEQNGKIVKDDKKNWVGIF